MIQVKYFNFVGQNLEDDINKWLEENQDASVIDIKLQVTTQAEYALVIYKI